MEEVLKKLSITPPRLWKEGINWISYQDKYCEIKIPNGPTMSISPALHSEANARLIIYAPEMLIKMIQAIKAYEDDFDGLSHAASIGDMKRILDAVCNKPWEEIKKELL